MKLFIQIGYAFQKVYQTIMIEVSFTNEGSIFPGNLFHNHPVEM
jgi:hypothetical protein